MQEPAIDISQIDVVLGGQSVLSSFSLQAETGEKICLYGASGCGKSTLLRCLLGLVIPRAGAIRIQSTPLNAQSIWHLRALMAWVPQDPDWGTLTVRDALLRPFSFRVNQSLPMPESQIPEWLDRLQLPESLLNKSTQDLSGGEKQRVGLVGALLLNRPILLLDEVTSALDSANRDRVREALDDLQDRTVLAVSHDADTETWADRRMDLGDR